MVRADSGLIAADPAIPVPAQAGPQLWVVPSAGKTINVQRPFHSARFARRYIFAIGEREAALSGFVS